MKDTTRVQDEKELLRIVAKLARKERLSESERADLEVALTPVVRSLVAKTVWRRSLHYRVFEATLGEAVQESWVIMMKVILPQYHRERGNLFAFVRHCLRLRLINWLERGQGQRLHLLADPNTVVDKRTVETVNVENKDEFDTLIGRALRNANIRDRKILGLRMTGGFLLGNRKRNGHVRSRRPGRCVSAVE